MMNEYDELALWHLLRSLAEYADHRSLNFARIVADVESDFRADY